MQVVLLTHALKCSCRHLQEDCKRTLSYSQCMETHFQAMLDQENPAKQLCTRRQQIRQAFERWVSFFKNSNAAAHTN